MSPLLAAIADLHLGAGEGYGTTPFGPGSRLDDQEQAWRLACHMAIEEQVDAVLFAGDAFHASRPKPAELLAFRRGLDLLRDASIPVYAINGNHDCSGADTPTALSLFHRRGLTLSRQPQVIGDRLLQDIGVAVATLPWTPAGRLVAARNGGDRDALHREAAAILVETVAALRGQIPSGTPAILMAHWSVSGALDPGGQDVGLFREPVLDLHDLAAQGWDAIVLGHIHRPQVLAPRVFYTGSVATVNFGEADVAHGFTIVDLDAPDPLAFGYREVPGRPFVTLDLGEIMSDLDMGDILEHIRDQELHGDRWAGAVVRVRYSATPEQARRVDHAAIKRALLDAGAQQVWKILPELVRAERARAAGVDETLTPLDALDRWIDHQQIDDPIASGMRGRTEHYLTGAAA